MIKTLPNVDNYPKIIMLQDDSLITLRPLEEGDKVALLDFFKRIPEEDRHYLKEAVTSPQVILDWTANVDYNRVIPIVAVAGSEIVADATLHLSRSNPLYVFSLFSCQFL